MCAQKEEVNDILKELSTLLNVLAMDEVQLRKALDDPAPDFEDNLQYQCAKAHGYNTIITNNVKHFTFNDITILTPRAFLYKQ